jgi:hypothetical protein
MLEDKHYEATRLLDESEKKADINVDLRDKLIDLEKEIEMIKA